MCEVLVRAIDGINPDPISNSLRGYLIVVQPDGHTWGRQECPPEYFIVKLPGVSDVLMRRKTVPLYSNDLDEPLRRRRYRLSTQMMRKIERSGGVVTITSAVFNSTLLDGLFG